MASGYRLYGTRRSGAAMIALALSEIGAEYEFVATALGKGAKERDAYLDINPTGKLPALETPEGEILTESAAILLTLAERHPQANLLPRRRGPARALVQRWTIYVAAEIYPMIEIVDYPERFSDSDRETLKAQARARIRRRWLAVEDAISGDPWLVGRGPTIADIAIANVSRWSTGRQWRAEHCRRIDGIAEALATRPSTRATWNHHFGP